MAGYLSDVDIQQATRAALRTSESLKVAFTALYVLENASANDGASNGMFISKETEKRACIFAVITHFDQEMEEGSIFVFDYKTSIDPYIEKLAVISTYPVTRDFSVSMAQTRSRSSTLDLRPGTLSSLSRANLNVIIQTDGRRLTLMSQPSQELSTFIAECKRLQELAKYSTDGKYTWLDFYTRHRGQRLLLPFFPRPDLRILKMPIHSRLSTAFAGQSDNEDADIEVIRDDWVRKTLDECAEEHSKRSTIRPFLPPLRRISPLNIPYVDQSRHNSFKSTKDHSLNIPDDIEHKDPDMIVLGLQEVDLSAEALLYSTATTREDAWVAAIFAGLGELRDEYIKLASKQLVGMLIVIIVKKSLIQDITDIKSSAIGTGIMGMMGNKGATAIRLTCRSTVLTFVNAHLPAFDDGVQRRNLDFQYISQRLTFTGSSSAMRDTSGQSASGSSFSSNNVASLSTVSAIGLEKIYESDVLFWMVNLNYRIDLPDPDVRSLLSGGPRDLNLSDLFQHDQLYNSMRTSSGFEGFQEGEIHHIPTYRFGAGLTTDDLGYDMKRRPAWTDRILHLASSAEQIAQLTYTGHEEITMSDHRPVSADFTVAIRDVDMSAYQRITGDLARELGDFEDSDYTPQIRIKSFTIDFGEVRYKCEVVRRLELENIGPIACAYRFIAPNEESPIYPSWLCIEPLTGLILAGNMVQISLTIAVDDRAASAMNFNPRDLEQLLILHIEHGKDNFISITGQYRPTCFGNDLSTLARLSGPIRTPSGAELFSEDKALSIPREYGRLIGWLMDNAIEVPDLFLLPGDPSIVDTIRECLDTGDDFSPKMMLKEDGQMALAFGQTLLELLASMSIPLIPAGLQERCTQATSRDEAFEVLGSLQSSAVNVWISLTALLHYIGKQSSSIKEIEDSQASRTEILAAIFAPILLPDDPDQVARVSPLAKRKFLLYFIQ